MAFINASPVTSRDTRAIGQGMPNRVAASGDCTYAVLLSDTDDYVHVIKNGPQETLEFDSSLHGNPLSGGVTQAMLAAVGIGTSIHIVYITYLTSVKYLEHIEFDMLTDTWVDSPETAYFSDEPLSIDCLNVTVCSNGYLHVIAWLEEAGSMYLRYMKRDRDGNWTDNPMGVTDAPVYLPCVDVDDGGRVLALGDFGVDDLDNPVQWRAFEPVGEDVVTYHTLEGMGQATMTHTQGNERHILFIGDKRHTKIKSTVAKRTTTLGALEFEQPDVDGGVIEGVDYTSGLSLVPSGKFFFAFVVIGGKLFQAKYLESWEPMRAIAQLSASRTSLGYVSATPWGDSYAALVQMTTEHGKTWSCLEVDSTVPPRGGVTHDIVIDGHGYMASTIAGIQKGDVSQAIPRISIATELRSEDTLTDLSNITQYSWHHGRGERIFEDPSAFFESDGILTHIANQITPQYASVITPKTGALDPGGGLVGPAGAVIAEDIGVGPLVPDETSNSFAGYPVDDILYNGNYYILVRGDLAADNDIYLWKNNDSEWEAQSAGLDTTSGDPQDLEIFLDDLFVAQGDSVVGRTYDASAAAWQAMDVPAYCFASFHDRLWRADNINKIYYSADPGADTPTWTELGSVDDGAGTIGRIRRMKVYAGTLLVFADSGVWQITVIDDTPSYRMLQLLNDESQRHVNNGLAATVFGGVLHYNTGDGLTRFDGSTRQEMGPNRSPITSTKYAPLHSSKRGQFSSMVSTDSLMYMAIDAGDNGLSTVYVYVGTGWHEFWQAETTGQRCRWVSHTPPLTTTGVMSNRLLWVEEGGTVKYIVLPRDGENPLTDPDVRYRVGGEYKLITGWRHYNLPGLYKNLQDLIARFENFGADPFDPNLHIYFQVEEGPDSLDTDDWYYLATFSQSPHEELSILDRIRSSSKPEEYGGAIGGLAYRQVRFMLVMDTDLGGAATTTTPPTIQAFGERFAVRTEGRFGWTTVLQAYDDIQLLHGGLEPRSARGIRNELYAIRDQRTPHTLDDGTLTPIINWVLNPGFELDSDSDGLADAWVKVESSAVTTVRSPRHKTHGGWSQKVTVGPTYATAGIAQGSLFLPPGVLAHIEINAFVESGLGMQLLAVDVADGSIIGRSQMVYPPVIVRPPAAFECLVLNIDPQEILREIQIQVVVPDVMTDNATTTVFYADSAMFHLGDDHTHYFVDGEQPRCQWSADIVTPFLNPSLRRGTYNVFITGLNEVIRSRDAKVDRTAEIQSDVTLHMRESSA